MRKLHFKVESQVLSPVGDFTNLVPGTEGYLFAEFEFSKEWDQCIKIASFFDRRGNEHSVRIVNGCCEIPKEVLVDSVFKLSVTMAKPKPKLKVSTNTILIKQRG